MIAGPETRRDDPMKIHEYQAKELLAAAGAAVPRGIVVATPKQAEAAFDQLGGGPVVPKAQVHPGGRGKGHFRAHSDPNPGGVKFSQHAPTGAASAWVVSS